MVFAPRSATTTTVKGILVLRLLTVAVKVPSPLSATVPWSRVKGDIHWRTEQAEAKLSPDGGVFVFAQYTEYVSLLSPVLLQVTVPLLPLFVSLGVSVLSGG